MAVLSAILEGKTPGKGKTVLLRADCDALPVLETKDNLAGPRVCCSKVDGVMHACGHDGHTAILLGAAKILNEHQGRDTLDKIILFFERAEENGGGMPADAGLYGRAGSSLPDTCLGHSTCIAGAGVGQGGSAGPAVPWLSVFGFNVTIHGKGGHGSRPDQANSPIDCFVAIYNALEAARLTKITPFQPLTVSVGLLQAGAVGNVIPNDLTFAGTARSVRPGSRWACPSTQLPLPDGRGHLLLPMAALLPTTSSPIPPTRFTTTPSA